MITNLKHGEDTVSRTLVFRRSTWDQLVHVTDALREIRDVDVSAAEVAVIALEAGLEEVRRSVIGVPAGPTTSYGGAQQLQALLDCVRSARARQRTIALWLGHTRRGAVPIERLRALAIEHRAYNVANFAQNMKKDRALFRERKNRKGERLGWKLTAAGERKAKEMLHGALAAV